MLRVLLQIVPGGDERRTREIGRLEISNVYEFADVSDYAWQMFHEGKPYKTGVHPGHPRKTGARRLLRQILVGMNLRELPVAQDQASPEASKE